MHYFMFFKCKFTRFANWGLKLKSLSAQIKKRTENCLGKKLIVRHCKLIPLFLPAIALANLNHGSFDLNSIHLGKTHRVAGDDRTAQHPELSLSFSKEDIHHFIDSHYFSNLEDDSFELQYNGTKLFVQTSIDKSLQIYLTQKLDRKNSGIIGIVIMDPADGRILAMVGHDESNSLMSPCVDRTFPAASIFKIVTAAAAIEKCDLQPDSVLKFNGRKHTLYKSQLTEKVNKYTNRISLMDAFAQSVNPVFGKLGALYLGKEELESYAMAFGFNRIINFELFLPPSLTIFSDEAYQLAEIASGFNKKTRITPVHGALIAATILNKGRLIEPSIVDQITDQNGATVYKRQSAVIHQTFNPETSNALQDLMKATIRSGTARSVFRRYRKDKIISRLDIGGKTGSINNRTDDVKYDWFVGYAKDKDGSGKIVVSVLVAHEKYIGIRATQYALLGFKEYFKNYFSRTNEAVTADPALTKPNWQS